MPDREIPRATRRLFVALAPPPEIAARLVRRAREALAPTGELPLGVRAYAADELHLTLCFLGSFPEARLAALERGLAEELRGLNAPELVIAGTGAFPSARRPRVLWARAEEDEGERGPRLGALRNRVFQAALAELWRPAPRELERPFRPHLTLARRGARAASRPDAGRAPASEDPRLADLGPFLDLDFGLRWLPEEVTLFESRPGAREERYRALGSVPLVVRPG